MTLNDIGFYTLCDARAVNASLTSRLWRGEIVLGANCNFHCPYCRHVGGKDIETQKACELIEAWGRQGLFAIRFSGGEPPLHPGLIEFVTVARKHGIERIAISTNGSAAQDLYEELLRAGVNDCSVSLDACCAEDGDLMAGGMKGAFDIITANIRWLAQRTYTTVGVVLTEQNMATLNDIIIFADSLGVADIRIIPAAQQGARLANVQVSEALLSKYPILRYRIRNIQTGQPVRGLRPGMDSRRCGLVLDDVAVNQDKHYPCIIYLRERGKAIGTVGPQMRGEREQWYRTTDTHADPICRRNCIDACVDYNNLFEAAHPRLETVHEGR